MKIVNISAMPGRNIYCHRPVIKIDIDLEDEALISSDMVPNIYNNIVSLLPGLKKHRCSKGYEGGFLERIKEGTYPSHVIEHVMLELQNICGYDVSFGKARTIYYPNIYTIICEYSLEKLAFACAEKAFEIVDKLWSNASGDININAIISYLKNIQRKYELGPSTKSIVQEAKARGIPVTRIGDGSLVQLGYGKNRRLIKAAMTDNLSCISADIVSDKQLTKEILRQYDIPVPDGIETDNISEAVDWAEKNGFPVIVKPLDSSQGNGVSSRINCLSDIEKAFENARKYSNTVIVERYISGNDYRVLVINGKATAVAERIPPMVKGDGSSTVYELIEQINKDNCRGEGHEKPLTKIKIDDTVINFLKKNDICIDYVPKKGEPVFLRDNANLSTGGEAVDCTEKINPENARLCEMIARVLRLDIAGIDIRTKDISKPIKQQKGAVIEVNACPGLRMHLYPSRGKSVNAAKHIVDMLYESPRHSLIPVVSVTGTNGKTTTVRLIKYALALCGYTCAMTSTSGIYIGDECIMKGDCTGPASARLVLGDDRTEIAVLETARGGLVRKGLGYDLADIGIVTNVTNDHIGLDGIDTIEDMAFVKALVLEAVKKDGYSVINADDAFAEYLFRRACGNKILFSQRSDNEMIARHIARGGEAVFVRDGIVVYRKHGEEKKILRVKDIAISMKGMLRCNIENALAAVCALVCLNTPSHYIRKALKTFCCDFHYNPGRFNFFKLANCDVLLDYGHNPAGYEAVGELLNKIRPKYCIGVIGMPGDRKDDAIISVAKRCCLMFNNIIIKEDEDLRGRKEGEVASIIYNALVQEGYDKNKISVVLDEKKAIEYAIELCGEKSINILHPTVAVFYENFEKAVEAIKKYEHCSLHDERNASVV